LLLLLKCREFLLFGVLSLFKVSEQIFGPFTRKNTVTEWAEESTVLHFLLNELDPFLHIGPGLMRILSEERGSDQFVY
jgi:hypothetical protein